MSSRTLRRWYRSISPRSRASARTSPRARRTTSTVSRSPISLPSAIV